MRFTVGVKEWWSDLGRIYLTNEVKGLERGFDFLLFALWIATSCSFSSGVDEIKFPTG
jgi:hypothetical protein